MKNLEWINQYNKNNNNEYARYVFSGEYLAIYKPEHHLSKADGYVYIHQLQAEKMLGRLLLEGEVVHHIDRDKYNNDINNLMVFKTRGEHTAFHGGDKAYMLEDGSYVCIKKMAYAGHNYCDVCGNIKSHTSNMCQNCYDIKRAENIPSKEILENYIKRKIPFTQIGKEFGVSDNAVRKWCKKYRLPFKKQDIKSFLRRVDNNSSI